jgi:hypothetical protein
MLIFKIIVIWSIFILFESINGVIRMNVLIPILGDRPGYLVSFLLGSSLLLAIAALFIPWLQTSRISQLLVAGLLWVGLTLAFEIALGRFILGYSWPQIAADYDLRQGGLMGVGLVWLALTPLFAAKIRGVFPSQDHSVKFLGN